MTSENKVTIGPSLSADLVRYLRNEKGKTLKQIGSSAALSESFLSRVSKGERNFRLDHLVKIAKSVRTSVPLLLLDATYRNSLSKDKRKLYVSLRQLLMASE